MLYLLVKSLALYIPYINIFTDNEGVCKRPKSKNYEKLVKGQTPS